MMSEGDGIPGGNAASGAGVSTAKIRLAPRRMAARTGTTAASVGAAVAAFERGATILRVHDVREHVEALAIAQAVAAS